LLWCAADTLLAHLHPDGNWSSLAYSQAGFAPALQIVSLLGVAGLVFVLSLFPAALALAALRGWPAARWPLAASVLLALGCLGFGYARIPAAALVQGDLVGMAVIDDFIGPRVPAAQAERIWSQYERHVETLAGQGARLVLLPEKIAVLSPAQAEPLRQRMAALAARTRVWLALGVGIDDGRKTNHLWLFAPDGGFATDYLKHYLAPPERGWRDPARARAGIPARRDALHAHGRSVRLVVYRGGGAAGAASPPPEANRYVPHDADSL
jgi:apolipoprotein N-acyltransferase